MRTNKTPPIWKALGLGVLAGMRTSSAPAIASNLLCKSPSKRLAKSKLGFMQSKTVSKLLMLGAIGEFIVDKLPSTPDRIKPGGLAFRSLSGGLAGACVYEANGDKPVTGALLGGAAALAATYGSFFVRKSIVKKTGHDPIVGSIEDVVIAGAFVYLAWVAAKNKKLI